MVGNRLKDFRKKLCLSKEKVAKMLFISDEAYDALESNKRIPDDTETAKMASLLGITKEYLQAGEYDLKKGKGDAHGYLVRTPKGWACVEKNCGWRQRCGDGVFYCPGAGCMKAEAEKILREKS